MCGRYHLDVNTLYEENMQEEENFNYENNFNITPQSKVPLVIDDKLTMAIWGFFSRVVKESKKFKTTF